MNNMPNKSTVTKLFNEDDYSMVYNQPFRRDDLSLRAKGLLIYLCTLPEDEPIYKMDLFKHFTNGRNSVVAAFKELEKAGYIHTKNIRNYRGQFNGVEYIIQILK